MTFPISAPEFPLSPATIWAALPLTAPLLPFGDAGMPLGYVVPAIECADPEEEDEVEVDDEEDLAAAQPSVDEESSFDDFDDDFDDDFEEETNDPDWDHPDDADPGPPPPGKGSGRKK